MIVRHETFGPPDPITGIAPLVDVIEVEVPDDQAPPSPLDVFDAAATGTLSLAKLKAAMRAALEALDG